MLLARHVGPGGKIPSRDELADALGVSRFAVHRGVQELVDAGLLVTDGSRGTFVSDHPPHRFRYAVAFGLPPAAIVRSPHFAALYRAASALDELAPRTFAVFGPERPDGGALPAVSDIPAQAEAGLLAGVLSVRSAWVLGEEGLQEVAARIPVAAMTGVFRPPVTGAAVVEPHMAAFVRRALDCVREGGRRRAAFLWYRSPAGAEEIVAAEAAVRGIDCPPRWRQYLSDPSETGIANLVHLLMEAPRARRPQALVVADDILTAVVCRKLAAMGLGSGTDPLVVALANYPRPRGPDLPVRWLGFDAFEWYRVCVESMEAWCPGSPCHRVGLPARYPEEVPEAHRCAPDDPLVF